MRLCSLWFSCQRLLAESSYVQYSPTIEHPLGASLPASARLNPSNVPLTGIVVEPQQVAVLTGFLTQVVGRTVYRGGRFRCYHAPKTVKLDFRS